MEGWNFDADRANGCGKTAIFNALAFVLYDKIPRGITKSQILREGTKRGFVECDVSCGIHTYTFRRSRPSGFMVTENSQVT